MAINKIKVNGEVKIDLTNDTVRPADVRKGKTFHGADGEIVEGSLDFSVTTAAANDVREGKIFVNAQGEITTGTAVNGMPDYEAALKQFMDGVDAISIDDQSNPAWEGVTRIPSYFYVGGGNGKLETLHLESITEIGDGAFAGAEALRTVIAPNCETIGMQAFSSHVYDTSMDGTGINYSGNPVPLTGEIDFSSVKYISGNAFANSGIENLDCPECKAIGLPPMDYLKQEAAKQGIGLDAMIDKVTHGTTSGYSGPGYTFSNCTNLRSINFPKLEYALDDFVGCTSLEEADLPSLKHTSWTMFQDCISLTSANMPECTYLGPASFGNCVNLRTLNAPKINQICPSVLCNCMNLEEINFPEAEELMYLSKETYYWGYAPANYAGGALANEDIPEWNENLKRIILPKLHIDIRDNNTYDTGMFFRLAPRNALELVDLSGLKHLGDPETLNYVIFLDGLPTKKLVLGSCETIGSMCLSYNNSLEKVYLPQCKVIGGGAFAECPSLKVVDCSSLETLQNAFPTYKGPHPFKLIIRTPDKVCELMALYAFDYDNNGACPPLTKLQIYVPDDLVDQYKAAANWNIYADAILPLSFYVEESE